MVPHSASPRRLPLRAVVRVFTVWLMATLQTLSMTMPAPSPALPTGPHTTGSDPASMNIGLTIRGFRQQKGLSQGDIEKRTGLLRCYLSRVENGHTIPSLDTLKKIAAALDLELAEFFANADAAPKEIFGLTLNADEIRFLTQIQRYSANLSDSDRRLLLAMVRKFAATTIS